MLFAFDLIVRNPNRNMLLGRTFPNDACIHPTIDNLRQPVGVYTDKRRWLRKKPLESSRSGGDGTKHPELGHEFLQQLVGVVRGDGHAGGNYDRGKADAVSRGRKGIGGPNPSMRCSSC